MHRPELNLPLQLSPVPKPNEMQTTPLSCPTPWGREEKKKVFLHLFITPSLTQSWQLLYDHCHPPRKNRAQGWRHISSCRDSPAEHLPLLLLPYSTPTIISEQMKAGKLLQTGREETIKLFTKHASALFYLASAGAHLISFRLIRFSELQRSRTQKLQFNSMV